MYLFAILRVVVYCCGLGLSVVRYIVGLSRSPVIRSLVGSSHPCHTVLLLQCCSFLFFGRCLLFCFPSHPWKLCTVPPPSFIWLMCEELGLFAWGAQIPICRSRHYDCFVGGGGRHCNYPHPWSLHSPAPLEMLLYLPPARIFVVSICGIRGTSPHLLFASLALANTIILAGGGGSWHRRRRRIMG